MSDDDEVCTRTATASDGEGTRAGESGAIAALGETKTSRLMELEARLAEKDFIMEPSAIDDVRAYVSAGGAPSTAIELLSENYRGYAAMTTLAVHWLKVTAPPRRGANTSPIKVSAAVETRGIDNGDGDATRTPTGGILTSGAGKGTPRERAATMETEARFDEMYFLEALVREKFDANKADAVFQGRPPAWLDGLFKSERGRAVLFSLAESNPNCLLISCAIQHAWQRGMRHEVRALGPAAAAYFSIFHELLADHVKGIIEAGDDDERRMDFEGAVEEHVLSVHRHVRLWPAHARDFRARHGQGDDQEFTRRSRHDCRKRLKRRRRACTVPPRFAVWRLGSRRPRLTLRPSTPRLICSARVQWARTRHRLGKYATGAHSRLGT